LLVICGNFLEIRVALAATWETVDKNFMERCTGPTFAPFPCSKLNFAHLWNTCCELRELIFTFFQSVYNSCHNIYCIVTSPDVDVHNLSQIIINAVSGLRKQLPRCDKAFDKIEESVGLLETNFDEYYKDYLQSNDSTNIFTNFISDVATNCKHDTQLIFQCRRIVDFFRKTARQKIASGTLSGKEKTVFDTLIRQYSLLDEKATAMTESKDAPKTETTAEPIEDDDRDLDELMRQIENPKATRVSAPKFTTKKN
jgi:hypothetical protein